MTTVVGVDIGGTHSRARLVRDDEVLAEAAAGSASLTAAGHDRAGDALRQLVDGLGLAPGADLDAICVGAGGSGSDGSRQFLHDRLAPLTRPGTLVIVNDSRLALPAAGLDEGVAIICGTGSIGLGVWQGREVQAGGLGWLLGDEGSGYWIVRSAIRELGARRDRGEALGRLGDDLLAAAGADTLPDLLQAFYDRPNPDGWARHAGAVLDSEDPAGAELASWAARGLVALIRSIDRVFAPPAPLPIALAGGLVVGHKGLQAVTLDEIQRALPGAEVRLVTEPPVVGAVRLAQAAAESGSR